MRAKMSAENQELFNALVAAKGVDVPVIFARLIPYVIPAQCAYAAADLQSEQKQHDDSRRKRRSNGPI